jgi:hypothetical protein
MLVTLFSHQVSLPLLAGNVAIILMFLIACKQTFSTRYRRCFSLPKKKELALKKMQSSYFSGDIRWDDYQQKALEVYA